MLPINIINEKIYVFLWFVLTLFSFSASTLFLSRFWLCILSVLTILDLAHHFILVTFRGVRWVILNRKLNTAPKFKVSFVPNFSLGEWVGKQMSDCYFLHSYGGGAILGSSTELSLISAGPDGH